MIRNRFGFVLLCIVVFIASCVAPQEFTELKAEAGKCKDEREKLTTENEMLKVKNTELDAELAMLKRELENNTTATADDIKRLKELELKNKQMQAQIDDFKTTNESLLKNSSAETKRLIAKLEQAQQDLFKREEDLANLSGKVQAEQEKLKTMRKELNARNARLVDLEKMVHSKDSATNALRDKVSNALLGFENQGLTVTKKNGKVYVSLDEKLLFGSGSIVVDAKGVIALKQLARVLEQNKDINITIEGHTDDVPVVTNQKFQDNWDLSVKRATSIIRILLENSTIDPKRLTAAGRGEFLPIDNSQTTEARRKNRRTEIILTPNLDEILKLLGE